MDLVLGVGLDSRILSSCSTLARLVDRQDPQGKLAAPTSPFVCYIPIQIVVRLCSQ